MGHDGGKVHGGTTYFTSVYPALVEAGVDLTVAFLSSPHPAAQRLREWGIEPVFFSRKKWDLRAVADVRRLVAEGGFDVLHLASLRSHFLGRLFGHRCKRPCLIHLHDTVPLPCWMRAVQRSVRSRRDLAAAVSGPVGELGVRDYGFTKDRVRVLHNAIEVGYYERPRADARNRLCQEWGLRPSAKLIGMVGRLALMKGHRYLFEAMPKIVEQCPSARLVVVGCGELKDELRAMVQRLKLDEVVRFVGQRDDVPDILAALDVLAMPSVSGEGLPFVALEAIATGLPIVAYPTAGIPEVVVHDHSGLLVEHGQVGPLAEALARVLNQPGLRARLSQGAKDHAQQFTMQNHIEQLTGLYRELSNP